MKKILMLLVLLGVGYFYVIGLLNQWGHNSVKIGLLERELAQKEKSLEKVNIQITRAKSSPNRRPNGTGELRIISRDPRVELKKEISTLKSRIYLLKKK